MAQEIYNEGRVVGFSAYEIFKRQCLDKGIPETDIPDERTWLSSMLGIGASLILQIEAGTTAGVHDYVLPANSTLTAAGVIFANPFMGSCVFDNTLGAPKWSTKITSYGPLIKNETGSGNHPTSSDVPYGTYSADTYKSEISEFIKISDGIAFVNHADWINTDDGTPYEDINPEFGSSDTIIRLYFRENVTNAFSILFTGFLNSSVLAGISGWAQDDSGTAIGGSTDTDNNNWKNGGHIGPELIPWANKIVFSVPSYIYNIADSISRTIPEDITSDTLTVYGFNFDNMQDHKLNTNSAIDFNSITLTDYYTVHASEFLGNPLLSETVTDITIPDTRITGYNEIIAWYPGMTADAIGDATSDINFFPPAIYATQVSLTGENMLVPLDTTAPGTVKCFPNSNQAYAYTQLMPDNYAVYFNTTTNNFTFVTPNVSDPTQWTGTAKITYDATLPIYEVAAGSTKAKTVALTYYNNGTYTEYGRTGSAGDLSNKAPAGKLVWDDLLTALHDNKAIDLFGTKLRNFATELNSSNTIGMANPVTTVGAGTVSLNPGSGSSYVGNNTVKMSSSVDSYDGKRYVNLNDANTPASIKLGENFIRFGNGLKLYILPQGATPPTTGVPTGSIGIGW